VRRAPRLRGCAVNLLLASGSVALMLVALEVALRLAGGGGAGWYAAGPERGLFLRRHVRLNADRFRDRDFVRERTAGVCRILAVGDSFTFGDGIERVEDTWPRVAERALRAAGRDCEVYNLGVPGTGTAFQRAMLDRRRVWAYRPDRLVLGFVLNDPEPPDANVTIVPRHLYPPLIPLPGLDLQLTRRSYAYAWLRRSKNRLWERLGLKETYGDYVASLYDPGSPVWKSFVEEARGLVRDSARRGVPVTVAIFPMFASLENYPFEREHALAAGVFERAGADVVDLLPLFRGRSTEQLAVAPADAHPNELAQRLAGERIARHLLSISW